MRRLNKIQKRTFTWDTPVEEEVWAGTPILLTTNYQTVCEIVVTEDMMVKCYGHVGFGVVARLAVALYCQKVISASYPYIYYQYYVNGILSTKNGFGSFSKPASQATTIINSINNIKVGDVITIQAKCNYVDIATYYGCRYAVVFDRLGTTTRKPIFVQELRIKEYTTQFIGDHDRVTTFSGSGSSVYYPEAKSVLMSSADANNITLFSSTLGYTQDVLRGGIYVDNPATEIACLMATDNTTQSIENAAGDVTLNVIIKNLVIPKTVEVYYLEL